MSVENGKVCCNCRRCIRIADSNNNSYIHCYCEVKKRYISYFQVMEGWCRHWATDEKKWEEVEE